MLSKPRRRCGANGRGRGPESRVPLLVYDGGMARPLASLLVVSLLAGCLPSTWGASAAAPSAVAKPGQEQELFHDPILMVGGTGMLLVGIGAVAGLVACQTENCLGGGTSDPAQASSPQVQYGFPVMAIGLATGLPLYIGAWVFAIRRADELRRQQLTAPLEPVAPTPR